MRMRYLQALNSGLRSAMERDESVFVVGEDIRCNLRGETHGLYAEFGGDRVLDTPISEAAVTGFATGAAMRGMRPVVEFQIPSLVYVAFDQLVNQAAKMSLMLGGQVRVPVTYLVMAAGNRPGLAGQHSDNPYPYLVHGGLKTVCPATPRDAKGLVMAAVAEDDPVAVVAPYEALGLRGEVPEEDYSIPLGLGEVKRSGTDVTVVAVGHLVNTAVRVAGELESEGISVEVWDPRTLLPFDKDGLFASVEKTGRVVIVDDSNRTCGYAAEIASLVAEHCFDCLRGPIRRITRSDVPVPFSGSIERQVLPSAESLAEAVRAAFASNSPVPVK
jgi:acetoin:2,6-dichlorophenolindophenol oxidoreductase subunit beta